MIDLFRPYINHARALENLAQVLRPRDDGRTYIGEGPVVALFEERIADLLGLPLSQDGEPRILAVNSCTMALTIALDCVGVGPGDEVISTPINCTAGSGAIVNAGARIVWADVDPKTGNIDPADVERKITPMTKAIMAVDWGGRLCDYSALVARAYFSQSIRDWQESREIPVIRDAAHSFLGVGGKGSADYVCYSFGPIKHLTCGGYGGAILTPRDKSKFARLARWHGLDRLSSQDFRCAQDIEFAGYRGHMTDDMAAVGLANCERVEWVVSKHRENAAYYDHVFKGLPGITPPPPDPGSTYWLYTILADDRDGLQKHLAERGVASSQVHRSNVHHAAFARQSRGADSVPNADTFDRTQLSIPVGWWLSYEEREQVAAAVISFACQGVLA